MGEAPRRWRAILSEDEVQIHALCDCALLRARPEQVKELQAGFRQWHDTYWRALEINRELASHFERPPRWRRRAVRLLRYLLTIPPRRTHGVAAPVPGLGAGD